MMEQLVIVADLGCLRAFLLAPADPIAGGSIRAREVDVPPLGDAPAPLHAVVTDQAGRFSRGNRVGDNTGMSRGEEHELEKELETRLLRSLARNIEQAVESTPCRRWVLAAPKRICKRLQEELADAARESLDRVETADLTKESPEGIAARFSRKS